MELKDYCVVVLGDIDGAKEEISRASESEVKFIKLKGLLMATFSSAFKPLELKNYLLSFNRNFVLFELGNDNYGVNLNDENIYKHLFGEAELKGSTDDLISDILDKGYENWDESDKIIIEKLRKKE
jgi:hypothetical protein